MATNLHHLALRDKSVGELRTLAEDHRVMPADQIQSADKFALLTALSDAAATNGPLARELRKTEIAFKPSFYLVAVSGAKQGIPTPRTAKSRLDLECRRISAGLSRDWSMPTLREFAVEHVNHGSTDIAEVHFTWQRALSYWSAEVKLERVYGLQFGFVVLDLGERKGIVGCHSETERDTIIKVVSAAYSCKLTALTLTRELLDQIGTFDKVKRAAYHVQIRDRTVPENITYADERLAAIPVAREEERNSRSVRQQSFYRITIGGSVVEQGVGATSKSGKLWIPRETPINTVRDFGVGLLGKISKTISALGETGDAGRMATVLGLANLPEIAVITPIDLREKVCDLIVQLANMLLHKENDRYYPTPLQFAVDAVPKLFNPPALLLTDEATGDTAAWSDEFGHRMVKVEGAGETVSLSAFPTGGVLQLKGIVHPLTGNEIEIAAPLSGLMLVPAPPLQAAVDAGVALLADDLKKLSGVTCTPFYLSQDKLVLDVRRAFGTSTSGLLQTEVKPADVRELRKAALLTPASDRTATRQLLQRLGEKCAHMSDDNCRVCPTANKYLCLRSLVARFFRDPLLLAHKSIEISDGQFVGNIGGNDESMFLFAKLAPNESGGLTARNNNGAILLSQVIGHIDNPGFSVVVIISPSTVNEDLRDRLKLVSGCFGKKLLVLDYSALAQLWKELRTNIAPTENLDIHRMIEDSRGSSLKKTGRRRVRLSRRSKARPDGWR
jgi:hypothetical protein